MATATEQLRAELDAAGLGDLADMVWSLYREGREFDYIYQQILESATYQDRFSGLISLREKDLSAGMSEGQYLQMERAMLGQLQQSGFGGSPFATQQYIGSIIGNNVSLEEFQSRVQMAQAAATTVPADVRRELRERYGVGVNNLVEYYMDTDLTEQTLLRQQQAAALAAQYERFQTMEIGTAAVESVAGQLTQDAGAAINAQEQMAGLGTLGAGLSAQERLEGAFGLNDTINRQRRARTAAFQGGGVAAATEEGLAGLGAAGTR